MKFPKLSSKVILAPMHEITNLPFRIMCKNYGAGLVYTELLSANSIAIKNTHAIEQAKTNKSERPVSLQLFSENIKNLVKAAKLMEKKFDIIDLNFGCPSEKIMKQGSGAALLKDKKKIAEIVRKVSSSIKKPLTVKIRNENAVEISKICEENGASAICIHARTIKQGYSGKADWNLIKKIKQKVKIPVIGNGDITDEKSAEKMIRETGCNYIMVGRAAIGNPFIFKRITEYLKTGKIIENQTKKERIEDYFEYIKLCRKYKMFFISDAKTKAQQFTKGFSGASELRGKLNSIKNWEEIKQLIKEF